MSRPASTAPESGGPVVGAVLAGGLGSRLGGTKATVELAGRPLISYPLAAVAEAGLEAVVVAKPGSELPPLGCRTIHEPDEPRHPLCGIVAALRYAGGRDVVAVGCDMPLLNPALLRWLGATHEPLVAPSIGGFLQPLPARYGAALLPSLDEALATTQPLRRTIESLAPRLATEPELSRFGDPRRLCFNVNTPADLREAEQLLEPATR